MTILPNLFHFLPPANHLVTIRHYIPTNNEFLFIFFHYWKLTLFSPFTSSSTGTFSSYAAMALKNKMVFYEITCLLLKTAWGELSQVQWMTVVYILTYTLVFQSSHRHSFSWHSDKVSMKFHTTFWNQILSSYQCTCWTTF